MRRVVALAFLCHLSWSPIARGDGGPGDDARAVLLGAMADYHRWVWTQHTPARPIEQRRCLDRAAEEAESIADLIREERTLGEVEPAAVFDAETRLARLEARVASECLGEAPAEDEAVPDAHVVRMRHDRVILRLGARLEGVPRVDVDHYELVSALMARGAVGGFVLDRMRLEVTVAGGWVADAGQVGSIGARVMYSAPWGRLRLGFGVAVSLVLAVDRLGTVEFSWLGVQVEIPLEVALELSEHFALTVIGGPMYTQAGQLQVTPRAIAGHVGLLLEVVL